MTEFEIETVAAAIDSVTLFSRFNDWTGDHVQGLPVEICRYGGAGEPEIVVVNRYKSDVPESVALMKEVTRAQAIAALKAMGK